MNILKQKLKLVPSPIKEMIEESIKYSEWDQSKLCNLCESFSWINNGVFNDPDFWGAIDDEIEYHAEMFNKNRMFMNHNINAC